MIFLSDNVIAQQQCVVNTQCSFYRPDQLVLAVISQNRIVSHSHDLHSNPSHPHMEKKEKKKKKCFSRVKRICCFF